MIPVIIWAGAAIIGAIVVASVVMFWDELKFWAEKIIPGFQLMAKGVSEGRLELIEKGGRYIKQVILYELGIDNKYRHQVEREEIPASKVPDEIKEKLKKKMQATEELKLTY